MKVEFNKTRLPIADRLSEISSLENAFYSCLTILGQFLSHRVIFNFSHCFFHKRNTLMSPFRNQQRKLHKAKSTLVRLG